MKCYLQRLERYVGQQDSCFIRRCLLSLLTLDSYYFHVTFVLPQDPSQSGVLRDPITPFKSEPG